MAMSNDEAATVPMCISCGHNHYEHQVCAICGHSGRSQLFKKMKSRAEKLKQVDIKGYGSGTPQGCDFGSYDALDQWAIIRELRGNICRASGSDLRLEFNMEIESNSRHLLGFIGSKPFFYIRYRLSNNVNVNAYNQCLLDRFGIIPLTPFSYDTFTNDELYRKCTSFFLDDLKSNLDHQAHAANVTTNASNHDPNVTSVMFNTSTSLQPCIYVPEIAIMNNVQTILQEFGFVITNKINIEGTTHYVLTAPA
jgi:hypothetical protein